MVLLHIANRLKPTLSGHAILHDQSRRMTNQAVGPDELDPFSPRKALDGVVIRYSGSRPRQKKAKPKPHEPKPGGKRYSNSLSDSRRA